ncbi:MAG: AraC family transcriptional regulator [Lachnospiraceae bacterium]|nr:AraC family transcriptional regulator [Lachnospiraceae bacterium]
MNKDPEIPNFQEGFTDLERYEVIQHQMNNEMANRARYTYQEELQFFQMVENGEVEKIVRILKNEEQSSREDVLQKVGVIARDSDFKQMEYTAVTEIALASRAAIRGNARPDICYDLSDLFLQKISVAKSVTEIYEISKQIAYRFSQEVLREKQERVKNPHVEQCKNYIAKHLYSRFTVEEMAKELSVSRTYLTGLFKKETGQSIRDYIIEHRVRAAANLLRYSNESIGQISDYMQFSSPGRFSQFFKRYYGTTPEIYRKENKMIEFTE